MSLTEKIDNADSCEDVITAFTEWLEDAPSHNLKFEPLLKLEEVIKYHFNTMDPGNTVVTILEKDCMDEEEMRNFLKDNQSTPSIYSL